MEAGDVGIGETPAGRKTTRTRPQQAVRQMKTGVARFFGVTERGKAEQLMRKKWENRSQYLMATNGLFGHTLVRQTNERAVQRRLLAAEDEVDFPSYKGKRTLRDGPDARAARPTVFKMTVDGMRHLMHRKRVSKISPYGRSFSPFCTKNLSYPDSIVMDDFFEYPSPHYDELDSGKKASDYAGKKASGVVVGPFLIRKPAEDDDVDGMLEKGKDETDGILHSLKRMSSDFFEQLSDNMNRSQIGIGFVENCLEFEYKHQQEPAVRKKLNDLAANEHRPFFTFWVTFVQIVIFTIAVAVYGIAPIGVSETQIEAEILKHTLSIERVHYTEPDNLWIGPRQADLIHLGARYSPCMRRDSNVEQAVAEDRMKESQTACCVRNDGSGCVQSHERLCSQTLSMWLKWGVKNTTGHGGRTSGSVCGQDPKYCRNPYSLPPFVWPDDISKWPICVNSSLAVKSEEDKHMKCQILGRPCCVGIQGQCIITTREFCEFRRGYFHDEATLCSQISCMNEICGMIPFYDPEKPNQFYRLWTSLFLHAGLFQLLISVCLQWFIMRDLEKFAGWLRIGIIYIMSGIAGSLGSAIFIPYHVEAGPSGSQFGILACIFVQVIQNWQIFENPRWNLGKLMLILVGLFIIGLMPMVDNWAHLFGFVFGLLLSFALLPDVTSNIEVRRCKLVIIIVCLVSTIGLFLMLVLLFYAFPIYKCPNCEYFNCIPFTPTFCRSMEVKITRNDEF